MRTKSPRPARIAHCRQRSMALLAILWLALFAQEAAHCHDLQADLAAESAEQLVADSRQRGDARRGAALFFQGQLGCAKCHPLNAQVPSLGPHLTRIAQEQPDTYLVTSILHPSADIQPAFRTVSCQMHNGRTHTGILIQENKDEIILRDASAPSDTLTIARDELDQIVPRNESLMPSALVNLLANRQQFLDLVRFLLEIRHGGVARVAAFLPKDTLIPYQLPDYERHVDHRRAIQQWDDAAFARGEAIYQRVCANCHGTLEQAGSLPTSLRFASGQFKNGSDPYAIYRTLTHGFGLMSAQHWMVPQQKYDVIHYIRQAYLAPHNRSEYSQVTPEYVASLPAGDTLGPPATELQPWSTMDYGPFLIHTYEVGSDGTNFAHKGIAIRLDEGAGGISRGRAWMVFDHDTLRMAGGWLGTAFIDWNGVQFNGAHNAHPRIAGELLFQNATGPGWADPNSGSWQDQRTAGRDGRQYGPLPRTWAHYEGLYQFGSQIVIAYTVADTKIREVPSMVTKIDSVPASASPDISGHFMVRTIEIGPHDKPFQLQIGKFSGQSATSIDVENRIITLNRFDGKSPTAPNQFMLGVHTHGQSTPPLVRLFLEDQGEIRAEFAPTDTAQQFAIWQGLPPKGSDLRSLASSIEAKLAPLDMGAMMSGGPTRWPERLTELPKQIELPGPFQVDVLAHPEDNPWFSRLRTTGFDFFSDGNRAAICCWDGDVWLVEGLLAPHDALTWRRIASGLFQPLGLKIVDDKIHITCRDQLVRLHDLNGDQETDYYENVNNDHQVTEHFHEFAMGLQVDEEGNFYYAKSARHALPALVPHHGTLLKISADGQKTDILATGFRAANGVCINGDGSFVVTDQEGHWNPKNRINWVVPGGFYGNMLGYHNVTDSSNEAMQPPLCWITNEFDRSPAELLWIDSPRWGRLNGSLLNLSYGYGRIYIVPHESVGGQMQGGMCALPIPDFPTGLIRGRFSPVDGQLYACGMYSWGGSREQPGGWFRIRYDNQPCHLPLRLRAHTQGIDMTFSDPIAPDKAMHLERYHVQAWGLHRSANYGSPHVNQHEWQVSSASVLPDGHTLRLTIPSIAPTWCLEIAYTVDDHQGVPIHGVIHNTIHHLDQP